MAALILGFERVLLDHHLQLLDLDGPFLKKASLRLEVPLQAFDLLLQPVELLIGEGLELVLNLLHLLLQMRFVLGLFGGDEFLLLSFEFKLLFHYHLPIILFHSLHLQL